MAKTIEIKVPDIGDNHDVPVIELLVQEGDTVAKEQALIVLESDKSTMEVPSSEAGVVRSIALKVGDKVSQGAVICQIETDADAAEAPKAEPKAEAKAEAAPAAKPAAKQAAPAAKSAEAPKKKPAAGSSQAVAIPDIGELKDVPVIEVLVKDGDTVTAEQPLLVLETDKATIEVPSPGSGVCCQARCRNAAGRQRQARRTAARWSRHAQVRA